MASKERLASAEEVFNKLKWHPALNGGEDFVVVCEDRVKGEQELSLGEFRPKSGAWVIPMHRVLRFQRASDGLVVWDRETRVDLVFNPPADAPSIYDSEPAGGDADSDGETSSASVGPGKSASVGPGSKTGGKQSKVNSGSCPFDYLAVMDFEATCDERGPGKEAFGPCEIIELPVVLVDTRSCEAVATYHQYVRPQVHPTLTQFCTELTGITQATVDKGVPFDEAWQGLLEFLQAHGCLDDDFRPARPKESAKPATKAEKKGWDKKKGLKTFAFVTCGDWDLKTMAPTQFELSHLKLPSFCRQWINVKLLFKRNKQLVEKARAASGVAKGESKVDDGFGMPYLLRACGLPLVGRHHSGIDDCKNIVSICQFMIKAGVVFDVTWEDRDPDRDKEFERPRGAAKPKAAKPSASESSASSSASGSAGTVSAGSASSSAPPGGPSFSDAVSQLLANASASASVSSDERKAVPSVDGAAGAGASAAVADIVADAGLPQRAPRSRPTRDRDRDASKAWNSKTDEKE